jgi:hypothetical protein
MGCLTFRSDLDSAVEQVYEDKKCELFFLLLVKWYFANWHE